MVEYPPQGSAAGIADVVDDTTPQLGGDLDGQGNNLDSMGVLYLTEQAEADASIAAQGQLWVDTATPNILKFTDDADTDFAIAELEGTQTFSGAKTFSTDLTMSTADVLLAGNKLNLSAITLQEVSSVAELTIPDNTAGAGIKIQNTDGSFSLTNGTSGADNFLPTFLGVAKGSTRPGLFFVGEIPVISDAGSVALIRFDARRIGPASILTRPLFQITNSGVVKWEMDKDGNVDQQGNNLTNGGVIFLTEQAEADTNVAGKGQIWVDTATPNILKFTDDADTDSLSTASRSILTVPEPKVLFNLTSIAEPSKVTGLLIVMFERLLVAH